jgi:hypothetical protein
MFRWSVLPVTAALAALVLGAMLAQCASPPGSGESGPALAFNAEQTAELLPGTWLREYREKGVQVRRLLTLEPQGGFHEVARVTAEDGSVTQFEHEGTWLYDGTNLKRRYTLMNGKPPSRLNLPFATFAIVFVTSNEFTGVDHIHANTIRYQRVSPGTAP